MHGVGQLLVPLGPLTLVLQELSRLVGLDLGSSLIEFSLLLVEDFPFFFEALLVLGNFGIPFPFKSVQLILQPLELVLHFFVLLGQVAQVLLLVPVCQLEPLIQNCLLTLNLLKFLLQVVQGCLVLLRLVFEALVELLLKLLHHDGMRRISFVLRV